MAKKSAGKQNQTPSFIITRRILAGDSEASFLDKVMNNLNRLYNNGVRHYIGVVKELREDIWFQEAYAAWKACKEDDPERKIWSNEVSLCMKNYGLTEYAVHEYLGKCKVSAFGKGLNIDFVQKAGSSLFAAIRKAVFRGARIHFRKFGQTCSFEGKKASSGIIYNPKNGTVKVMGRVLSLKAVRESDAWMIEALGHRVKYCRIKREPFRNGYRYFLQLVMEGVAPKKLVSSGNEVTGIDEGVSTVTAVNKKQASFHVLADGIEKYDKDIRSKQTTYERRRRLANQECFNEDGTIKKGARFRNHTRGTKKALMELKDAYRKRTAYVKNCHGYLTNRIIEESSTIVTEPMNFRALQRRSKSKAERSDKATDIKQKDGTTKTVRKYKRKKRFGSSINKRSPGMFNDLLRRKASSYGVNVIDIDLAKYRASQYDHSTDNYRKPSLSERGKMIGNHRVQRDLYSGFLLSCYQDETHPDRELCNKEFKHFLVLQGKTVAGIIRDGDTTGNFGLKFFISDKNRGNKQPAMS